MNKTGDHILRYRWVTRRNGVKLTAIVNDMPILKTKRGRTIWYDSYLAVHNAVIDLEEARHFDRPAVQHGT